MSPLLFHPVHGVNVQICENESVAERICSDSGGGIIFSHRPVQFNEKVCMRCMQISANSYEGLRFGFSKCDPKSLQSDLGFYTGFASRPEFWAKDLWRDQFKTGDIVSYSVNKDGDVHLLINGEEKEVFLSEVKFHGHPLFALIEIFGDSTRLQLIDENKTKSTGDLINLTPDEVIGSEAIAIMVPSTSRGNLGQGLVDCPSSQYYQNVVAKSMHFHRTKGKNAHVGCSGLEASRRKAKDFSEYSNAYVFTARPVEIGESFVVKIKKHNPEFSSSMAMGITSCDPNTIRSHDLPDDPNLLLDRPEYWLVEKNIVENSVTGDEFCFTFTYSGEILIAKNGDSSEILMHVDDSIPLWILFDLHGSTTEIILLGKIAIENKLSKCCARPPSAPVWNPSMAIPCFGDEPQEGTSNSGRNLPSAKGNSNGSSECTICCERPVDSVFLPCGHMCMCYGCAKSYGNSKASKGGCPICREPCTGIVRTYKS